MCGSLCIRFDTVPHDRLIGKLQFYGITGPIKKLDFMFLKNHEQSVLVDGVKSGSIKVESGVPQGTVLGPLLFLLYINDLPRNVSSHVSLFADDCLLYIEIRDTNDQLSMQNAE